MGMAKIDGLNTSRANLNGVDKSLLRKWDFGPYALTK